MLVLGAILGVVVVREREERRRARECRKCFCSYSYDRKEQFETPLHIPARACRCSCSRSTRRSSNLTLFHPLTARHFS